MNVLGLDVSTQRLKATIIDEKGAIIIEESVYYDTELREYHTKNGVIGSGKEITTPTIMWIHALDVLLHKLRPFLSHIRAISGSGQQHGSIYWTSFPQHLDPCETLHVQFGNSFGIKNSPIWQDSSTREFCELFETCVGSPQRLADLTGSSAYERFTGPQIAKIARKYPAIYASTERISLVSSLFPSILTEKYAQIDPADASGMNLMNIYTKAWIPELLACCGADLASKLGAIGEENAVVGRVSNYFCIRYGIPSDCIVTTFSGDNPCSLSSFPMQTNDLIISFGTSDTCMFAVKCPSPKANIGHIFRHPNSNTEFMGLLCFRNGSLAREYVRDKFSDGSWETFNLQVTNSLKRDLLAFYFIDPEIIPLRQGVFYFEGTEKLEFIHHHHHPRAILQSQTLMKKYYCDKLGLTPQRVIITGGGSINATMAQVVADVFGVNTYQLQQHGNSASLGACYRALHCLEKTTIFDDTLRKVHPGLVIAASPDKIAVEMYAKLPFDLIMSENFEDK